MNEEIFCRKPWESQRGYALWLIAVGWIVAGMIVSVVSHAL